MFLFTLVHRFSIFFAVITVFFYLVFLILFIAKLRINEKTIHSLLMIWRLLGTIAAARAHLKLMPSEGY